VTNKKDKLGNLINISRLDLKTVEIERKIRHIPFKLEEIKQKLNKGRSSFQVLVAESETNEARRKVLQEEINEFTEKAEGSKAKLYEIKTNEAYKMALKEIDNWTHEKTTREEEIIKIMENLEKNKPEIDRLKERFQPEEEILLKEEKEITDQLNVFKEEQNKINDERKTYIDGIDKRVFSQYERIRKAKKGIALVEVHSANCTGCNLTIRPQVFNQLMKGDVQKCCHCGRMMFYHAKENNEIEEK
jgi:predicted  nucleic acid-binding Zn-ribbon protein